MIKLEPPALAVFDLDDTLYDYQKPNVIAQEALITEFSRAVGKNSAVVAKSLLEARERVKKRLGPTASSHSRLLYISETFRLLKLKPNALLFNDLEEVYWTTFIEEMEISVGAAELLAFLSSQGTTLALVTDLTSNIQYRKLNKLGLNTAFDFVVTSEEVGGDKVSGLPFNFLKQFDLKVSGDIWFFGDSEFDYDKIEGRTHFFFKRVKSDPLPIAGRRIEFQNFPDIQPLWK